MAFTLEQIKERLQQLYDAQEKVTMGQAYAYQGRTFTRANLLELEQVIALWEAREARMTRGGIRVRGVTPA